jgi:ABC-type lipoprotein export system ATPase subunit
MNKIFLPDLIKIKIENFNLYSNAPIIDDTQVVEYDFIYGVNVILGGNGSGKTTFINTIKYALIGLYNRETMSKIYKDEYREKRGIGSYSYFKDRMNPDQNNKTSKVTLTFSVNDKIFTVCRDLYEPKVVSAQVNYMNEEKNILGRIISQKDFDSYTVDDYEKKDSLQYKLEKEVYEACGFSSFDDLIRFVNYVLIFDEKHDTILWNSEFQKTLMLNYFGETHLMEKHAKLKNEAKYYDSMARHRSEDQRAISKVIDKYKNKENNVQSQKDDNIPNQIRKLEASISNFNNDLYESRFQLKEQISNQSKIRLSISQINLSISELEDKLYNSMWGKLNDNYQKYQNSLKQNICPMCFSEIKETIKIDNGHCIMCNSEIKHYNSNTNPAEVELLETLMIELDKQNKSLSFITTEITNLESKISNLNEKINKIKINLINLQSKKTYNTEENKSDNDLNAFEKRYQELELEKIKYATISKKKRDEVREIDNLINQKQIEITKKLSIVFQEYSYRFTGMPSYLTYSDNKEKEKQYIPVINEIKRYDEDSLSESQKFFIDQSFRMSILDYFYTTPSFFICETPNSSLDVAYEKNAAELFIHYLNKTNKLIITTNISDNEFIKRLLVNQNSKIINMLELGFKTSVQTEDRQLQDINKNLTQLAKEI